ncbi:hypothetical protein CLOM_g10983 [Closterium sp. NIES-68]|nr:hypothetical protein CLOM_g310 [Closterium sp. NIES-68]GJP51853.1 hypothetical protein CLOM_g10983 [Closterium sp. NIES-68]GJP86024.1 hypothetical protein CLOP_g16093 [Closterium sp. NIES-67]
MATMSQEDGWRALGLRDPPSAILDDVINAVHETWQDGIEELQSCIMEKCPEAGKSKLQQDLDQAYHLVEAKIEEHMEAFKAHALATVFNLPPSVRAHLATLPPPPPRATSAAAPAGSAATAGVDDDLAAEEAALDAELAELHATLAQKKAELRAMRRQQRQQQAAANSEGQLHLLQQMMHADNSELMASHERLQAQMDMAVEMTGDRESLPQQEEGVEGVALLAAAHRGLTGVLEHAGRRAEGAGGE